jgi:hypothetical protein
MTTVSLDDVKNIAAEAKNAKKSQKTSAKLHSPAGPELPALLKTVVAGDPEAKIQKLRYDVQQYYNFWPELKPKKSISADASLSTWQAEYQRVANLRKILSNKPDVTTILNTTFRIAEFVTDFLGGERWFGISFRGLKAFAQTHPEVVKELGLEDEVKELTIKYGWLFAVPTEIRFIAKIWFLAQSMNSMLNPDPSRGDQSEKWSEVNNKFTHL